MIDKNLSTLWRQSLILAGSFSIIASLAGCDAVTEQPMNYRPMRDGGWVISTPEQQGLEAEHIAALYKNADKQDTLYSLLVIKNGFLVAEQYFNGGSAEEKTLIQSASKSYISALVGIAIEQGCLSGIDQKMLEFFPELYGKVRDPEKREITLRQMLQMRTGYPDEETDAVYLEALYRGFGTPLIEDFPLVSPPGAEFHYSNMTYSWLAILLERACGTDLKAFAKKHLFDPIDTEMGDWLQDREGHYVGSGGIHVTARDAARFGLLYLNGGAYEGVQVVPAQWVHDSLQTYSPRARDYGWGFRFKDLGYGYGWWTARSGPHDFCFAWGHGGQLIVLLKDLDMVIVTTADPFFGQHDGNSWKHEKAIFNLVGEFIESLPSH